MADENDLVEQQRLTGQCTPSQDIAAPLSSTTMADGNDLAEQERRAGRYSPDSTGPLVSGILSTEQLKQEYANTDPPDPVYVQKTENLAIDYPEYRTVRGDGSCGWRAVAFCYFNTLLKAGDAEKIRAEHKRLQSKIDLFTRSGLSDYVYEDWVEAMLSLLLSLVAVSNNTTALALLEARFNDKETDPLLVTYLRTLTSLWMKENPDNYLPYINCTTMDEWCKDHVDPSNSEIEEISLRGLYDVLLNDAGIALEVAYLDRSPGDRVNIPNRFVPSLPNGQPSVQNPATIRLLYRPGHYDILCPTDDNVPISTEMLVMRARLPQDDVGSANYNVQVSEFDPIESLIPGFDVRYHNIFRITNMHMRLHDEGFQCPSTNGPRTPRERKELVRRENFLSEDFAPHVYDPDNPNE